MGFLRQEYWSGLLFPFPEDLPCPGIKSLSPVLAGGHSTTEPPGKTHNKYRYQKIYMYKQISTHIYIYTHIPTSKPHFIASVLQFTVLLRYCLSWIESLWQTCVEQVYRHYFSNSICSLYVSMPHFDNSCKISNFFIIMVSVMVISDQWSIAKSLWLAEDLHTG